VLKKTLSGRVHHLLGEWIQRAVGARAAQYRQRNPLPDHGNVPGLEDRPGGLLEPLEVLGHFGGVVVRA